MLSPEQIKFILDDLRSPHTIEHFKKDLELFQFYNGATKPIIKEYIKKEFKKPETIEEMIGRLVPLNFLRKVVNKKAGVYIEAPLRVAPNKDTADAELLAEYEETLNLNQVMKEFNRYFKLNKRAILEIYTDGGFPALKLLPAHTYKVYSFDKKNPTKPEVVVKFMGDKKLLVWTKEELFFLDDKGQKSPVDGGDMTNPYGELPFIYACDSIFSTMPILDDDMMSMSIAIPVALTDLMFGLKYQAWPIIYTIGANGELTGGPQAVYQLDYQANGQKPEIGVVSPEFDAEKILNSVKFLLDSWLSTNNLSNNYSGSFSAGNAVSGVSKMLDYSENVEDKKDQQAVFYQVENDLWYKIKDVFIPYWRKTKELDQYIDKEFSKDFEVYISFKDPKPFMSEKEKVEIAKLKIDSQLSSKRAEIKNLNEDYDDEMVDNLVEEIIAEQGNVFGSMESDLPDQTE